jgi:methylglutaconyl-CoA hydratase
MGERIRCEIDARGVARLTLDRADKHNAFDDVVIRELTAELERLGADARVRVVVLTGAGRSFSAGADLGWMRAMAAAGERENREDALALARLMRTLDGLTKPAVARVNGPAYGGGVGLVACCDIAIASSDARFAFTEVRLGLAPAVISPYVIAAIGARRRASSSRPARASTRSARSPSASCTASSRPTRSMRALRPSWYSSSRAAPPRRARSRSSSRWSQARAGADDLEARTTDVIARLRASPEGKEGLDAFLGKREPGWRR